MGLRMHSPRATLYVVAPLSSPGWRRYSTSLSKDRRWPLIWLGSPTPPANHLKQKLENLNMSPRF